ncbi:MAG: type IV pilus twitching motility protein PilT [Planctomycetota bacterium]|jgi:twitching motility protein PilT
MAEIKLTDILDRAWREGASDILITAGISPVLYVNGKMLRYGKHDLSTKESQEMIYAILEADQIARFESERELDFSFTYDGFKRFRGNAFYQRGAVSAALRLINNDIPALDTLGLPDIVREFADEKQGLLLVTGPTGHGKSTTLASIVDHINQTRSCHIVTIEDPIEFVHTNKKAVVNQREVGTDTKSFASAVHHVLRQAPHIILVGEMRSLDTINAALTAAETGHLVLATLHTNDAAQTIDRIVDVFPPNQQSQVRVQLSMSLLGIVSQRIIENIDDSGRVLACEVLKNIPAIGHLVRQGRSEQLAGTIETNAKFGMQTMDSSLKKLFFDGLISEEKAKMLMKNPQSLFG